MSKKQKHRTEEKQPEDPGTRGKEVIEPTDATVPPPDGTPAESPEVDPDVQESKAAECKAALVAEKAAGNLRDMGKSWRELRCKLTVNELHELADKMGRAQADLEEAEEAKKLEVKEHGKAVEQAKKNVRNLSRQYNTGYTYRMARCRRVLDLDTEEIIVVRIDTGEEVERREATPPELQATLPGVPMEKPEEDTQEAEAEALPGEVLEGQEKQQEGRGEPGTVVEADYTDLPSLNSFETLEAFAAWAEAQERETLLAMAGGEGVEVSTKMSTGRVVEKLTDALEVLLANKPEEPVDRQSAAAGDKMPAPLFGGTTNLE